MDQVIWTESALSDLDKIAEYIALDKVDAAQRLVQKVFDSVERLEAFPESGRILPELEGSLYREIIVGPCRIFYRCTQQKVYVLHVMRGERQLRKYLLNERSQENS